MNTFPKSEILRNKKLIGELFHKGSSFNLYPFKVIHLASPGLPQRSHQVMITVPKKIFKRAVDRNAIKRKIKEAYRLHKHALAVLSSDFYLIIGYIYVGKEIAEYQTIEDKLKQSLMRLIKEHS